MEIKKKNTELDHACKDVCSGWQHGYEKGKLKGAEECIKLLNIVASMMRKGYVIDAYKLCMHNIKRLTDRNVEWKSKNT